MVYLEYHKETKQVVEIHEDTPIVLGDYDYVISDSFNAGDEFIWTIWINEVGDDKNLISVSQVKNVKQVKRALHENAELKNENADVWFELMLKGSRLKEHDNEIADVWYSIMTGGVA